MTDRPLITNDLRPLQPSHHTLPLFLGLFLSPYHNRVFTPPYCRMPYCVWTLPPLKGWPIGSRPVVRDRCCSLSRRQQQQRRGQPGRCRTLQGRHISGCVRDLFEVLYEGGGNPPALQHSRRRGVHLQAVGSEEHRRGGS